MSGLVMFDSRECRQFAYHSNRALMMIRDEVMRCSDADDDELMTRTDTSCDDVGLHTM